MAVRKQSRDQKTRASNRRRPFNPKIIGSNISDARDELNQLLARIDAGALHEEELQVGLLHAYHHLNFAWNMASCHVALRVPVATGIRGVGKISFGLRNLRRVISVLHAGIKIDPVLWTFKATPLSAQN